MPVKLGYKSIDESGGGKAISGKKVINRLRSMKFFGKKEVDNNFDKKADSTDSASTSETTAELSPVKSEENESIDDKFDLYFASSYLPHMPVTDKDELDILVENPSIHCQAFSKAIEMVVPPAPPQKARTRRRSSTSKVESGNVIRPKNLSHTFAHNSNIPQDSNTISKTKQQLFNLIEAVEHSHSDFNVMLKRMSSEKISTTKLKSRPSEQEVPGSGATQPKNAEKSMKPSTTATTSKKSTVPKTMDDIKGYISQLRAGAGTPSDTPSESDQELYKKYQLLFKSKMGSIARTFSSVTPDVTQASSSCEANMCNFMEAAEELMNPTLNQSGYVSPTPLSQSWLEVDEDSDSVSKLTMPFHHSELNTSEISEFAAGVDNSATRTTIVSYDWD